MSYNSKHTGAEVDALLDKAGTAVQPDGLAAVATSGSYNDLSDKPTIPDISGKVDKVVGKQLSTEDFTSILKSKLEGLSNYDDAELSNAVSTLRNDFDELVSGDTTTAIKTFNEVIAFLDGVQDTQDLASIIASIEQQIAGKQDTITDLEEIRIGAAKGATAIQDISGKQDKLVSGTNIKTINGTSLLGSGDIAISAAYPLVNHGTSNTTFTLTPNVLHVWGTVSKLTLTLGSEVSGVANEYLFQFTSGSTATTLSLPSSVKWQENLTVEKNKTYQVSILNGFATVLAF